MAKLTIDPRGIRLLLVDSREDRRERLAAGLLQAGYGAVVGLANVAEVTGAVTHLPDLVLLDVDGAEVGAGTLDALRAALNAPVPIVGLTDDGSAGGRDRLVAHGVDGLAIRPIGPGELGLCVQNALTGSRLRRLLGERSAQLTEALRERTAETDTVRESLSVLAAMADYHDDDTDRHADRVGAVAAAIASRLGQPDAYVAMLRGAAPLHDIGKVGISRRILLKPGKLTAQEWIHMQQHVEIGAQILASAHSPVLTMAAEIARTHHERFDGSGYTTGLGGTQIPLSGRIVAVADVWDTLTHDRPYRPAWETARALEEIHDGAGSHFDPSVVEAFTAVGLDETSLAAA